MSHDAQQLQHQLVSNKAIAERGAMITKLRGNKEFREVILKFFCTEECARYAHESADPMISLENRADALAMAQAAGHLLRFMQITEQLGRNALAQIPEIRAAMDELEQATLVGENHESE